MKCCRKNLPIGFRKFICKHRSSDAHITCNVQIQASFKILVTTHSYNEKLSSIQILKPCAFKILAKYQNLTPSTSSITWPIRKTQIKASEKEPNLQALASLAGGWARVCMNCLLQPWLVKSQALTILSSHFKVLSFVPLIMCGVNLQGLSDASKWKSRPHSLPGSKGFSFS